MGVAPLLDPGQLDFSSCFRAHYPRLVKALRVGGADPATAQDLAQEAFARALLHWGRISKGSNPPGYVYTAAFRALRRRRTPERGLLEAAGSIASHEDATATELVAVQTIAAMPPKRRVCAVMCLMVGCSTSEAAHALGIAESTVRKHLEAAREDLENALRVAV
ncbi:MAG: RNA polymerase sigma factor [Acidimicrobiales bacterium]